MASLLIKSIFDEFALLFLESNDTVFNGVWNKDAVDLDGFQLANAVSTIDSLLLDVRVPKRSEYDDLRSGNKIET